MLLAAEKRMEHLGPTCGAADHRHDLVPEVCKRLDAPWRNDQRIVNADSHAALQALGRDLKHQEQRKVRRLTQRIGEEIQWGCV